MGPETSNIGYLDPPGSSKSKACNDQQSQIPFFLLGQVPIGLFQEIGGPILVTPIIRTRIYWVAFGTLFLKTSISG